MRVLYNNLISGCLDLAMTNLDSDSSVDYLYHPFLELVCSCTELSSVVSGTFASISTINAIAIGYHNATTVRLVLKNVLGSTVLDTYITLEDNGSLYYVTQTSGVHTFELTLSNETEALFVGCVSIGQYVTLPDFSTGSSYPIDLRSTSEVSLGGQTYGVIARPLMGYEVEWPRITNVERGTIIDYSMTVQTCVPHFIDLFPNDHDQEPSFYGVLSDSPNIEKRLEPGFVYKATAKWREAR